MIDKNKLIEALFAACEKDSFKELPSWVINVINKQPKLKIDGNTSDGYHTFNELYHHRAILFSVICNQNKEIAWKSKQHHDGTMYDGMFIVGVETPQGQYSYHYDIDPYWDIFNVKELEFAPEWDGHEPKDVDRLLSIGNNPPLKFEELEDGMWVWDSLKKEYIQIEWLDIAGEDEYLMAITVPSNKYERLYSNYRFYRREVNEND